MSLFGHALQGCTCKAPCDLDHAYLSNCISCLSPQLTLMEIQKPFCLFFCCSNESCSCFWSWIFYFVNLHRLTLFHHAGLSSNSISPKRPSPFLPYAHPTHRSLTFFSHNSYHHQKISLNFIFVSLVPIYKSRVLVCLIFASHWSGWCIASSRCIFLKQWKDIK